MRDTGLMINITAKAKRLGQMVPTFKVYTIKVCERAMVQCTLRMEASTGVTLSIMKLKARVLMNGLMEKFTMGAGNSIEWMDRAS